MWCADSKGEGQKSTCYTTRAQCKDIKSLCFLISFSICFDSLILVLVNRKLVLLMMVSDDDDNIGVLGTEAPRTFLRWPWTCG